MPYIPTPAVSSIVLSSRVLSKYSELEVSLEVPTDPLDPDSECPEYEFLLYYKIAGAEPDVGIMQDFVDDFFYYGLDGPLPLNVQQLVDNAEASYAGWSTTRPVYPALARWHQGNLERASEDDGAYDYDD